MTVFNEAQATADTGAPPHQVEHWHAIDWRKANQMVRRLQTRIVKAMQSGKHGKRKALQWLLTHSYSARALAVKRVTENHGKNTPGVDGDIWSTPEKKINAVRQTGRRRGYRPQPLRRIYIPKASNPKKLRPLSIPCMAVCQISLDLIGDSHNAYQPASYVAHKRFQSRHQTCRARCCERYL